MRRLTFILGLPGSGKSRLADELVGDAGVIIDDISVETSDKLLDGGELVITSDNLIVTDPNACTADPDVVMAKLREWFGDRETRVIAFANDVDQCWANLLHRADDRVISRSFLLAMSQKYEPERWGEVRPVWSGAEQ